MRACRNCGAGVRERGQSFCSPGCRHEFKGTGADADWATVEKACRKFGSEIEK